MGFHREPRCEAAFAHTFMTIWQPYSPTQRKVISVDFESWMDYVNFKGNGCGFRSRKLVGNNCVPKHAGLMVGKQEYITHMSLIQNLAQI